jgi:hypothetical protein
MTTLRKWRFTILIGSGLVVAGALVYFSNGHVGTDKTQGAIGKRDVYRDGQVASADVATPGSAPVAIQAILESSEFKALAKNPAFQQLVHSDQFAQLSQLHEFGLLLNNADFQALAGDSDFSHLVNYVPFQQAIGFSFKHVQGPQVILSGLHEKVDFVRIASDRHLKALLQNPAFLLLVPNKSFDQLLAMNVFGTVIQDHSFALMAASPEFNKLLVSGTLARMTFGTNDAPGGSTREGSGR